MSYSVWGWGGSADEPTPAALRALAPSVAQSLDLSLPAPLTPRPLPELPASRLRLPTSLAHLASEAPHDRARHGIGRSYRDLVRAIQGSLGSAPDLVLRPGTEQEVADVLDWASRGGIPVLPFGGGTSVVGGVEPVGLPPCVSLDLGRLSGLLELDAESRSARFGAGTLGPAAEAALRPHGLTLRFYPQSFERSTLGGWLATRAAGHFSAGPTHIDDLVQSIRAVSPTGSWESRRLPASGAGPSPDRLLLGSEGALGVLTEAWLRVQPRPAERWSATLAAPDLLAAAEAVRRLLQTGTTPATCRVVDAAESALTGTLGTGEATLLLGLESLGVPLAAEATHCLAICRDAGLRVVDAGGSGSSAGAWRSSFLQAPYLREQLVLLGVLVETFETAVLWSGLPVLVDQVTRAVRDTLADVCGEGRVTCRLTHVYRDGAAAYFTVLAPGPPGAEVAQWDEIKAAASDAVLAAGGSITHHHGTGRDHRPWYDAQRPDAFARSLAAAKDALDPAWVMNPGVLVDRPSR